MLMAFILTPVLEHLAEPVSNLTRRIQVQELCQALLLWENNWPTGDLTKRIGATGAANLSGDLRKEVGFRADKLSDWHDFVVTTWQTSHRAAETQLT
jgi:hypothetical protein